MIFRHPKVVEHLIRNRIVATMRNYKYEANRKVLIKTPKGVFRGRIVDVVPNTPENRAKLYRISGFNSPDEWLAEALKLHRCFPKYIVVVQIVP